MQPFVHPDPSKRGNPGDDLYIRAGFMQERRRFQGALSGADDHNPFPRKVRNCPPFVTVRGLAGIELGKNGRLSMERSDPGSHYHTATADHRTIL